MNGNAQGHYHPCKLDVYIAKLIFIYLFIFLTFLQILHLMKTVQTLSSAVSDLVGLFIDYFPNGFGYMEYKNRFMHNCNKFIQ